MHHFFNCITRINGIKSDNAEDLVWQCTIYLNSVKIIKKQQEVCGITTEMNQIVVQIIKI